MNTRPLKFLVKSTIILSIAFFVIKSMYIFTVNKQYNVHTDSGTIISRSTDEVAIKHGSSTELYLNIKFDKSGFRAIKVEPTTYFKFKKGDRVSFILKDTTKEGSTLYFFAGLVFYVIACIILLYFLITWAFDINWN